MRGWNHFILTLMVLIQTIAKKHEANFDILLRPLIDADATCIPPTFSNLREFNQFFVVF